MTAKIEANGSLTMSTDGLTPMKFADLIHKAAVGKDFILLADSHSDASIIRNAFSKESIAAMKEAGVKHLAIEFSKDDQGLFDGFASGKYTIEQVQRAFANYSNSGLGAEDAAAMAIRIPQMMQEAKDAGISIHCVDLSRSDPRFEGRGADAEMEALADELRRKFKGDVIAKDDYLKELDKVQPGSDSATKII